MENGSFIIERKKNSKCILEKSEMRNLFLNGTISIGSCNGFTCYNFKICNTTQAIDSFRCDISFVTIVRMGERA